MGPSGAFSVESSPTSRAADEHGCAADERQRRKRKSTYEARKGEIASRREQLVVLRDELHRLKLANLRAHQPLAERIDANAVMRRLVRENQLAIAATQSLVASYAAQYGASPMATYIHLPVDATTREQILNDLKAPKAQEALAFMVARTQFTDLNRSHRQLENVETPNGDHVLLHWEIARITEKGATVAPVYDELLHFKTVQEMAIAEQLGITTVRESDSCDDTTDVTQMRLVATTDDGVEVEKNVMLFTQFVSQSPWLNQPHALMVTDYVDQEDLFPYHPQHRVRKDVCSVTLVVQCPLSPTQTPGVAIVKWTYIRIHHSPLTTVESLRKLSLDGVRSYFDVMLRSIRERLACSQKAQ